MDDLQCGICRACEFRPGILHDPGLFARSGWLDYEHVKLVAYSHDCNRRLCSRKNRPPESVDGRRLYGHGAGWGLVTGDGFSRRVVCLDCARGRSARRSHHGPAREASAPAKSSGRDGRILYLLLRRIGISASSCRDAAGYDREFDCADSVFIGDDGLLIDLSGCISGPGASGHLIDGTGLIMSPRRGIIHSSRTQERRAVGCPPPVGARVQFVLQFTFGATSSALTVVLMTGRSTPSTGSTTPK